MHGWDSIPKEALSVGDLVRWYDYYHDGIVNDGGLGIVLKTRVYEYIPPDASMADDGTLGSPANPYGGYERYFNDPPGYGYDHINQKRSHSYTQYFVYKTKHMTAEWLPREWLAPV